MELIELQENVIVKTPQPNTINLYERWTRDESGNVIRHHSFDLKNWESTKTPYKKIPVFILKRA